MNKVDLIAAVAEKTGMTKKDTERVVTLVFDTIADAIASGDKVQLAGFGAFEARVHEAREGRNPKTGEPVVIPAGRTPVFKAGKGLKDKVTN